MFNNSHRRHHSNRNMTSCRLNLLLTSVWNDKAIWTDLLSWDYKFLQFTHVKIPNEHLQRAEYFNPRRISLEWCFIIHASSWIVHQQFVSNSTGQRWIELWSQMFKLLNTIHEVLPEVKSIVNDFVILIMTHLMYNAARRIGHQNGIHEFIQRQKLTCHNDMQRSVRQCKMKN